MSSGSNNKKNWIQGAIGKPGALHAELHIPEGEKIPGDVLEKAANAGGKLGRRARLAQTLGKLRKAGPPAPESK